MKWKFDTIKNYQHFNVTIILIQSRCTSREKNVTRLSNTPGISRWNFSKNHKSLLLTFQMNFPERGMLVFITNSQNCVLEFIFI